MRSTANWKNNIGKNDRAGAHVDHAKRTEIGIGGRDCAVNAFKLVRGERSEATATAIKSSGAIQQNAIGRTQDERGRCNCRVLNLEQTGT